MKITILHPIERLLKDSECSHDQFIDRISFALKEEGIFESLQPHQVTDDVRIAAAMARSDALKFIPEEMWSEDILLAAQLRKLSEKYQESWGRTQVQQLESVSPYQAAVASYVLAHTTPFETQKKSFKQFAALYVEKLFDDDELRLAQFLQYADKAAQGIIMTHSGLKSDKKSSVLSSLVLTAEHLIFPNSVLPKQELEA